MTPPITTSGEAAAGSQTATGSTNMVAANVILGISNKLFKKTSRKMLTKSIQKAAKLTGKYLIATESSDGSWTMIESDEAGQNTQLSKYEKETNRTATKAK